MNVTTFIIPKLCFACTRRANMAQGIPVCAVQCLPHQTNGKGIRSIVKHNCLDENNGSLWCWNSENCIKLEYIPCLQVDLTWITCCSGSIFAFEKTSTWLILCKIDLSWITNKRQCAAGLRKENFTGIPAGRTTENQKICHKAGKKKTATCVRGNPSPNGCHHLPLSDVQPFWNHIHRCASSLGTSRLSRDWLVHWGRTVLWWRNFCFQPSVRAVQAKIRCRLVFLLVPRCHQITIGNEDQACFCELFTSVSGDDFPSVPRLTQFSLM